MSYECYVYIQIRTLFSMSEEFCFFLKQSLCLGRVTGYVHSSRGEDILHSALDRGSPGISLEVELGIYELRFQGPQKASKGLAE